MHLILQRPHMHAGVPYDRGQRLDVDSALAEWLLQHGIARPAKRERAIRPPVTTEHAVPQYKELSDS